MLKRIMIIAFVLSTLAFLALAPMNAAADSSHAPILQTVEVTVSVPTLLPGATPAPGAPGGIPMGTLIIFALVGLVALGIIIGGAALLNRRQ